MKVMPSLEVEKSPSATSPFWMGKGQSVWKQGLVHSVETICPFLGLG